MALREHKSAFDKSHGAWSLLTFARGKHSMSWEPCEEKINSFVRPPANTIEDCSSRNTRELILFHDLATSGVSNGACIVMSETTTATMTAKITCYARWIVGNFIRNIYKRLPSACGVFVCFNWLTPARFELNCIWVIFKQISEWLRNCHQSLDLTWKSTLVQVMACCLMAASHDLNQCWPSFMSPYGHWVIL